MSMTLEEIAEEALDLPVTARAELAAQLLESLDELSEAEADELWAVEAERRYDEYKAGRIESVSATELFESSRPRTE